MATQTLGRAANRDFRPPIQPHSPSYRLQQTRSTQQLYDRASRKKSITPRNGAAAKIIYQNSSPEDHMVIHIKEYKLHQKSCPQNQD